MCCQGLSGFQKTRPANPRFLYPPLCDRIAIVHLLVLLRLEKKEISEEGISIEGRP